MLALLPILLGAVASPVAAAVVNGTGTISVLANPDGSDTNMSTTTPSDTVGCLNAKGRLTLGDCATFSSSTENTVAGPEGMCSFFNTSQPANTDSSAGRRVHAFFCWPHEASSTDENFMSGGQAGMAYDFIGTRDAVFYYDIPALPESEDDEVSVWYFSWSGSQTTVPEGHFKAMLLWEQVASS